MKKNIIKRLININLPENKSAFLWGPRKTGKSHWINNHFSEHRLIDLLKTDIFADYASRPSLLREQYQDYKGLVIIDEIQIVPDLLNEIHWLIENSNQNIPTFSDYFKIAAITSGKLINYTNVARETGVKAKVIKNYFQFLEDTLLGFRVAHGEKLKIADLWKLKNFIFLDVGEKVTGG